MLFNGRLGQLFGVLESTPEGQRAADELRDALAADSMVLSAACQAECQQALRKTGKYATEKADFRTKSLRGLAKDLR